jgi:hypothetical protein
LRAPAEISSPTVVLHDDRLRVDVTPVLIGNCQARPLWNGRVSILLREVSKVTGATIEEMRSRSREQHVVQARRLAMIAWTRELHRPAVELGRVFGLTSATTSALVTSAPPSMRAAAAALATRLLEKRAA